MPGTSRDADAQGLSTTAIVERACEIVDADGVEALTYRSLASSLGVTPMALYWHVSDKEALLSAVLDSTLESISLKRLDSDPFDAVTQIAHRYRRAFAHHPQVVLLLTRGLPPGPAAGRLGERTITLLGTTGLGDDGAVNAFLLLAQFLMGSVVMEHSAVPSDGTPAQIAASSADQRFDFGLRCLVEGLRALANEDSTGASA